MNNEFERMQRQRRKGLLVLLGILAFSAVVLTVSIVVGEDKGTEETVVRRESVTPSPAPVFAPSVETLEAAAAIQLVALANGDVDQANELLDRFTDQWRNCEFLVQAWRASSARALGAEIAAFRESVLINPPHRVPVVGVATAGGRKRGFVANAIAASCS